MTRISGLIRRMMRTDLAAEVEIRHEVAIRPIQEVDRLCADHFGRGGLFGVPQRAESSGSMSSGLVASL